MSHHRAGRAYGANSHGISWGQWETPNQRTKSRAVLPIHAEQAVGPSVAEVPDLRAGDRFDVAVMTEITHQKSRNRRVNDVSAKSRVA